MAAACLAPLAIALRRFAEGPNILFSPRNSHVFRLPQSEGINGSRRPMAARIAMTIAHAHRRAGHGEVDRSTETTSDVAFWTRHSGFLFGFKTLNDGVMLTVRNRNLATRACTDTDDLRVYCWEVLAAQPAAAFVGSNIRAILRAPQRGTFQPHLQAR
jgi:hypothetical protein